MNAQHGTSAASWTGISVILVGAFLGGFAVVIARPWLFAVAVGIAVLGVVTGKVMSVLGFGAAPGYHRPVDEATRDTWAAQRPVPPDRDI